MKLPRLFVRPILPRLSALLLIGLVRLPLSAAEPTEASPDHAEERKVLEMDLARFYGLLKQDPDPRTKVTLIGYQRDYAARANKLLDNFDAAKYDELRYDINLQYQRIASYLAPLRTAPPLSEPTVSIELRNLSIDPANPAEVRAALGVLDTEIKRASTRATSPAELARLERLKQRRAQLGQQFTTARWDELLGEFAPTE